MRYSTTLIIVIILTSCMSTNDVTVRDFYDTDLYLFIYFPGIKNEEARNLAMEGMEYAQKGEYKLAVKALFKSDSIEPENVMLINSYAQVLYNLDQKEKAYNQFEKAISVDKTFDNTYTNYAYCLNHERNTEEAINILSQGFQYVSNDIEKADFYYDFAVFHYNLKNCDSTIFYMNRAVKVAPAKDLKKAYKDLRKPLIKYCK